MNIKYRLLCKRLIEERKRVGVIQYYNVLFSVDSLNPREQIKKCTPYACNMLKYRTVDM